MIAVDASIALKLVLNEPLSEEVRLAWTTWTNVGEIVVAPALFRSETLSVLRKAVLRDRISSDDAETARNVLSGLSIEIREPPGLYEIAWDLAKRYHRPNIYDCCYLALATIAGCDFWTADARLAHVVQPDLAWVRLVGEHSA